jgi:hypothetical protein
VCWYQILDSHGGEGVHSGLLDGNALWSRRLLQRFRRNVPPPSTVLVIFRLFYNVNIVEFM